MVEPPTTETNVFTGNIYLAVGESRAQDGVVTLSPVGGTNTYSGRTEIFRATLRAEEGVGLPVASRLVLKEKVAGGTAEGGTAAPERTSSEDLMGREGTAVGDLRPSGTAMFGDQRVDVVTEGDYVIKGSTIKVIEVRGNRVVVRRTEGE